MIRAPVTGLREPGLGGSGPVGGSSVRFGGGLVLGRLRQAEQRHEGIVGAGPGVVARQQPDQAVEVAVERRVQVHLHAEVLDHRDALGARDPFGDSPQQCLLDAADAGVGGNGDAPQRLGHLRIARRVLVDPRLRHQAVLHEDGRQGRQAPGVGARTHREVEIRHRGGLAAPRIDDDEGARRVVLDLAQDHPRARETVRLPRVLADEHGHLAVLEIAVDAGAHHLPLHPCLAGLLLGERIGAELHPQRLERAVRVRGAEVVALVSPAVIEDALAAMLRADRRKLLRDFADGGGPVDPLVCSVGSPAQRTVQPVRAVLVVVQPLRLLAHVALRDRMRLVAADANDPAPVRLHLEAAIHGAESARGLLPTSRFRFAHPTSPSVVLRRGILRFG